MAPLIEVVRTYGLVLTTHASEPVGHSYPSKGQTRPAVLWWLVQNFPDIAIAFARWVTELPFYTPCFGRKMPKELV